MKVLERMYESLECESELDTGQGPGFTDQRNRANSDNKAMELIQMIFDTCHESLLSPNSKGSLRLTCKHLKCAVDKSAQSLRLDAPITQDLTELLCSDKVPGLRELRVNAIQPEFNLALLSLPQWPQLATLHLNNLVTENSETLQNMFMEAKWPRLEELVLTGAINCDIDFIPATVTAMAAAFPALRRLTVQALGLSADAFLGILYSFPLLEALDVAYSTAPGLIIALATAPLPNLRSLTLSGVPMGRSDMYMMSHSPWFANLREFNACDDEVLMPWAVDQQGVSDLLAAWKGGPLRSLRLGPCQGLEALLEIRNADLPDLQSLTLACATTMGSEIGGALSTARLPALQELFLYAETCQLLEGCVGRAWESLGGLERPGTLPSLSSLHLLGMELTPTATEDLGRTVLPRLCTLSLVCCGLSLPEVNSLVTGTMATGEKASSPGAPNLQELYLPGNGLDLWSLAVLASSAPHFPALECLDLGAAGHLEGVGCALSTACAAGAWPRLRQLRCTFMDDADAVELASSARKWPLQLLDISPAVSEMVGSQLAAAFPQTFVQWGI